MRNLAIRFFLPLGIVTAELMVITGCSFTNTLPSEQERQENIQQLIIKDGYANHRRYDIEKLTETWQFGDKALEVSILAPKESGAYPLIIYLPGLGQHADDGRIWREYWAAATEEPGTEPRIAGTGRASKLTIRIMPSC